MAPSKVEGLLLRIQVEKDMAAKKKKAEEDSQS
jgi:hypothetical protein